jgi:type I restriction enzyme S subunit
MTRWPLVALGEVADVRSGSGAPQDPSAFGEIGYPFVRAGSLASLARGACESTLEHMTPDTAAKYRHTLFPAGSVLFAKSGMSATKGLVHVLHQPAYVVSHLAVVLAGDDLDPSYLRHCLAVVSPTRLIKDEAYPSIRLSDIASMAIPLPPLSEQQRIAHVLNRIEALLATRLRVLKALDDLPQAMFVESFGDPRPNPRGWPLQKFGSLGNLDRGVSKHRPRNAPELLGGPYPLVQTGEVANCGGYIRSHGATYSEVGLKQSKLWPAGTLCITIAANIAKTGILTFDACFPDSVVGFRPGHGANAEFVRVWLSFLQQSLEDSAPESAQKNINLALLRDLDVPVPPVPLQEEFARRMAVVERLKASNRTSLARIRELYASAQHRAFFGDL